MESRIATKMICHVVLKNNNSRLVAAISASPKAVVTATKLFRRWLVCGVCDLTVIAK